MLGTIINRSYRGTCVGVLGQTGARVKNVKTRRDVRACKSRNNRAKTIYITYFLYRWLKSF